MSDILYSAGLDATDLNTGADAVERRLEASGVKFAEAPRKFAKSSADAFQQAWKQEEEFSLLRAQTFQKQVDREEEARRKSASESASVFEAEFARQEKAAAEQIAAEQRLAEFRAQMAFRRLSDEEKVAVLRHQALSVLEQAQGIEGQSAEKSRLLLQYEEKKSAIFDLNKKIQSDALVEQKRQTEEVDGQNKKYTGLSGTIELIKKGFKDVGVSIQGAGIGVFVAALSSMAKEAISNARTMRDLYEQIRRPLDTNTASLARFGDGLESVKKGAVSFVGYIVSGYTLIGENIGSVINRMRGISEAQEKIAEASEREAKYQEEMAQKRKQEQYDRVKIREIAKEVAESQKKYDFDRLNDEQQWSTLVAKNLALRQQLINLEKTGHADTVKYQQLRQELIEQNTLLLAKDAQLVKEVADRQISAISTVGQLAITYQEKQNVLKAQEQTLLSELKQLEEKRLPTQETVAKLQALGVQQVQLQREHTEKISSENSKILEIAQLLYKQRTRGLTEVEQATLNLYKLQTQQLELQYKVNELIEVKKTRGLNPAEQKTLDSLFEQQKILDRQIAQKEGLIKAAQQQAGAETDVQKKLDEQLKNQLEQGATRDQAISNLLAQGFAEDDILKKLDARKVAEKSVTDEIGEQLKNTYELSAAWDDLQIKIKTVQGRSNTELSDRELAEKIQNLKNSINQEKLSDPFGKYDFLNNQARLDLERALAEQQLRSQFRQQYSSSGDKALLNYSAYDEQRLRNYIRDEDTKRAQQTLTALQDIQQRFASLVPKT